MMLSMTWDVEFDDAFEADLAAMPEVVGDEVAALAGLLRQFGPGLRRPHCDTLSGSKHANMKELRFTLPDGEWRIAFAFDPKRRAILLVGGSKSGISQRRFYRDLIRIADHRFDVHLERLKAEEEGSP